MTNVVRIGSDLERQKWVRKGLVQASSQSFWSPYTGNSKSSIIYQENDSNAKSGHTVVFDFDGNLSGKAIKGKDTAFGKGEAKRKFSDKCTVERYRMVVDNGDKFDGVNVGDTSLHEHKDSRAKLSDLFVRWKDQSIFDSAQGNLITTSDASQPPSHIIDLGNTFDFNSLLDIENSLKTSTGFSTGGRRRPLEPWKESDQPMWLFVIDSSMANKLRKDTVGYQTIMRAGDVRGNNNRNLKGIIGRVGPMLIVEADQFFGETSESTGSGWRLNQSSVEIAGLRQYEGANPATAIWTGQEGFDPAATDVHSRGLILGAGAMMTAFGKQPDYHYKSSQDFDIKSESALEVWYEVRKTVLKAENTQYKDAKISDIDYGVIAVDVQIN